MIMQVLLWTITVSNDFWTVHVPNLIITPLLLHTDKSFVSGWLNFCCFLILALALANCSKWCKKKSKSGKIKKTQKTIGTTIGIRSGATTGGNTGTAMGDHKNSGYPVGESDQSDTKASAISTYADAKNADGAAVEGGGKGGAKAPKKVKKGKTTSEDQDEKDAKKTATKDETKAEVEYNHENTLRIEMVDDDHTKTTTVDQSACLDAYDVANNELVKRPSQINAKQQSDKGKGKDKGKKKKKNTTVQSVDCGPPPADDKATMVNVLDNILCNTIRVSNPFISRPPRNREK
ncbi:Protein CBG04251 [Caenorhabditis briggsae]|uniref:Protein CBG04251 n=1 Tax=Caenorhabditis briggsae TaxID=6238 RepID=A8WX18_CAEBR|nr:Protein CBG04251 [Caenorhabditis briggsae]CAP24995.1 Protein CBG04251 [Caenorhabditis briggsae]